MKSGDYSGFNWREAMALVPAPEGELLGQSIALSEDVEIPLHPLDTEPMKRLHGRLFGLYQRELDRQHENRKQQAKDSAFEDGKQWSDEEKAILEARGQTPLCFNQIKPIANWLDGNALRNRADFKVLGRGPEDVKPAEIKTALLKYLSDVNNLSLHQQLAFADARKVGIGWLEDGVQQGDDGEEIYSRHVPWREVLHDSHARQLDLSDARYLFRHGYYDVDTVVIGFDLDQSRYESVLQVAPSINATSNDDVLDATEGDGLLNNLNVHSSHGDSVRERVLLIECWYTVPEQVEEFHGGSLARQRYDASNELHQQAISAGDGVLIKRMRQSMRLAVMTESALLWEGPSPYRHNRFPYTPIWCYRDDETGLPYGINRGLLDLQFDVNKRASKALHILSTNKVLAEKGAIDEKDIDGFLEEAARPDAFLEYNKGFLLDLNVDRELAPAHLDMMRMSMAQIQSSSGVTDEQLGRTTNAVSGAAITARQDQGALQTANLFDMFRHARQWQGQKMLANIEQFMTESKVIRITNAKGREEFIRLNDKSLPESVLTATQADFIISDSPQAASMRLAQAEQLSNLLQRMPPDIAVLMLPTMIDLMDIPNKDEFIKQLRSKLGIPAPDAEQTPEQLQQAQAAAQQQQMQMAMQQLQLEEARNKAAKLAAETGHLEAKIVRERVAAMNDAVQAATVAVSAAPIAATADDMLASAGFEQASLGQNTPLPQPAPAAMPAQISGAM